MYRFLQSIFVLSTLLLGTLVVDAQSTINAAMQNYKKGIYPKAIEEFNNSLFFLKGEETPQLDSISYIYEHLQFCYINRMKIDSALIVLNEAESYFLNSRHYKHYVNFKMARAETITMIGDIEKSKKIFEELIEFEYATNFVKLRCYLRLAGQYLGVPDKDKSYFCINESLRLAEIEKDSSILGNIYDAYGGIEYFFGSKQKAINYYITAIPFLEKDKKYYILASVHRKIGHIFFYMDNLEKAEEYTYKGIEIAKEHGIKREEMYCQTIIGRRLIDKGEVDKGIELLETSLDYFKKRRTHNQLLEIKSHLFIGYLARGDLKKAEEYIESSKVDLEKASLHSYIFKYHNRATQYYTSIKNENKASYHLKQSELLLEKNPINENLSPFFLLKSRYERAFGNYDQALEDIDVYIALKDSLNLVSQSNIIHDLESKYKKKEQDKEIALLNSENELKASELSKQQFTIFGGLIALIIFGLLSIFIYRLYKKVHSQNAVIKTALDEKDTLLREIHHRVKNNLQVISSLLALQSKYVADEAALSALKQGQDRVQSMALIHQELYENNDMTGVNAHMYLEQLMENLFDSYNIDEDKISYKVDVDEIVLDVDTMIPLGLIVNELVSNALKHAFKESSHGEIFISLKEVGDKLYLKVSDDGKGVESISDIEGKSFGFELIKAFTKKLKAEMNIVSENGLNVEIVVGQYKKAG
jgi:two-component sensor histidine kinase